MTQRTFAYVADLDARFAEYHRRNPRVYKLFKQYAFQVKRTGREHFGGKVIMERIRWYQMFETNDPEGFKINNSYVSRYVRLLVKEHPEFEGFFETRRLRS